MSRGVAALHALAPKNNFIKERPERYGSRVILKQRGRGHHAGRHAAREPRLPCFALYSTDIVFVWVQ